MNRIWQKDDFFHMGGKRIDMDPTIVDLPRSVPLCWQYDFERAPLGVVTNIRLEDGEILGDLEIFDEKDEASVKVLAEHDDIRLSGYYSNICRSEDGKRVERAHLSAVSFVVNAQHPAFKKEGL